MYVGGLELANAYSELIDPKEQQARFEVCKQQRRRLGKPIYPVDEYFMSALQEGISPSGGIALGIDRLVMLFSDTLSLDDVLPFRKS
ncbi:MAG: hypothetical protein GKR87_03475 [Kiritimatiellae bacterium]|nr:hypothetical protein [Kiritimatiellia bacterium]